MVSIDVSGGRTPHDALRDAVDWGRVVVATVARGVVATLLGLALWAAAPAVIGWLPTTVMTGSMEPRLFPGDVVVSRPVAPVELRVGQVLLAEDPDQAGHLRMHRYVQTAPDGSLVTKGDANPDRDSTAVDRSAVQGVAFLRIPFVGTPIVWLHDGEWRKVAMLVLGFAALLWLATVDGSLRRLAAAVADDDDRPTPPPPGAGLEAPHAPVTPAAADDTAGRERRLARTGRAAAAVLVAGGFGVLLPTPAVAAPWAWQTANTGSVLRAATAVPTTALTCTPNGDGSVTIGFTYAGAPGVVTSFDALAGSTVIGTAPGTASSVRVVGTGILSLGAQVTVTVRTNLGGTWTATSTSTTRIQTALIGTSLSCA